jgi:hypothetical protein
MNGVGLAIVMNLNHAVVTGKNGNISAFAWRRRKTEKTCVKITNHKIFQMHTWRLALYHNALIMYGVYSEILWIDCILRK